ncbi:MAG: Hsp33 family molecular chaperone HslO [Bdellovibrionales bacterium]|nr:Hsp33 family molecular chaperone HslO [Bdellovibrionales bacterium]
MQSSQWRKYISQPGNIRVVALEVGAVAHELCSQQKVDGPARRGFCEAIAGALLIASAHKSNESINLNAQSDAGSYRHVMVDASPEGRVRGLLRGPEEGESAGAEGWGPGVLSVLYTKNFEGKSPYTGMVSISTGHLDDAINEYYRDSEQLVSRVGLHVHLGETLETRGVLVQALGGATAEELDAIRSLPVQQLRELAALTTTDSFEGQLSSALQGRRFQAMETTTLTSFCTCSQERIERALLLTGKEDTLEALADDPIMTITCDFCRTEYKLSAERVRGLFKPDPSRLQ